MRKSESFCLGSGHVTFWQWLTEEIPREQKWDRLSNVSMGGSWDQSLCIPKGQLSFCQPENEGHLRRPQSIKSLGVWKMSTFLENLQGTRFCATPWKHDMWQHTLDHIMELVPSFHLHVGPRTSGFCGKCFTWWASLQPMWLHLNTLILMVWKFRMRDNFQEVFLWYMRRSNRLQKVSLLFLELASEELSSPLSPQSPLPTSVELGKV